ncbi:MAG: acyl-CoA thioesterase [Ruminococcus sp.]|nr:acyl-CoA thioesterase [Ruminococcus sp.]
MVFYHETDRMDIVNHSNYIYMTEEARVDFMGKIGVSYEAMEKQGVMLPVLGVTCRYLRSLHFVEHFSVYSYITKYNSFKLELKYEIFCTKSGEKCAISTSSHYFTNTSIKPIRICDKYPEMDTFFQLATEISY